MSAAKSPSLGGSGKRSRRFSKGSTADLSVEERLLSFTQRFPSATGKDVNPDATFVEQLELLKAQKELGTTLKDFMDSMILTGSKQPSSSMGELMDTLSIQKDEKKKQEDLEVKKYDERVRMQKSATAPILPSQTISTNSGALPSTLPGSAKFSFGKPRHEKGPFKIKVLEPRDPEYFAIPGGVPTPGIGTYTLKSSTVPEADEMGGGRSGGWPVADHLVFMDAFKKHGRQANHHFFEHLYHELPHVHHLKIVDHVRWLANFEGHQAGKDRNLERWREERQFADLQRTNKLPTVEEHELKMMAKKKELKDEKKRCRQLLEQADAEEKLLGISRHESQHDFQAHQRFEGQVLNGNLRGVHPCYKNSPGYTWSYSKDMRDVREKNKTDLSHVRSSSALDNPGPGEYTGLQEKIGILKTKPSWTFGKKLPGQKVDQPSPEGPGYSGPGHAWEQLSKELKVIQNTQPTYSFKKEKARMMACSNEMHSIVDKFSTPPGVGPGKYEHATCMVSQF